MEGISVNSSSASGQNVTNSVSASKSGLPPFSTFADEGLSSRLTDGFDGVSAARFMEVPIAWDLYGNEGLSARLMERGPNNEEPPQYRPWESKGEDDTPPKVVTTTMSPGGNGLGIPTFTDAFGAGPKLPSFQSQFTYAAEPQTVNGDLPTFHTLTQAVIPYPLVPAPMQAREIPAIQQQYLDERHIQLLQPPLTPLTPVPPETVVASAVVSNNTQFIPVTTQSRELPIVTMQVNTQAKPSPIDVPETKYQRIETPVKAERGPKNKAESRKKEKRKRSAAHLDREMAENSGQVAAVSSTAPGDGPDGFRTPMLPGEENGDKPTKKKRKRCGECLGCQRKDNCGDCAPCRNEKSHQICKMRRCEKLTEKKPSTRGDGSKSEGRGRQSTASVAPGMPFYSPSSMRAPPPPPPPSQGKLTPSPGVPPPPPPNLGEVGFPAIRERFPNAVWHQADGAPWPHPPPPGQVHPHAHPQQFPAPLGPPLLPGPQGQQPHLPSLQPPPLDELRFRGYPPQPLQGQPPPHHLPPQQGLGYLTHSPSHSPSPAGFLVGQPNYQQQPVYIHNDGGLLTYGEERHNETPVTTYSPRQFVNGPPSRGQAATPIPSPQPPHPSPNGVVPNGPSTPTSNGLCHNGQRSASRPPSAHYETSNSQTHMYVNAALAAPAESPTSYESEKNFVELHPNGVPGYPHLHPQQSSHNSSGYPGKSSVGEMHFVQTSTWPSRSGDSTTERQWSGEDSTKIEGQNRFLVYHSASLSNCGPAEHGNSIFVSCVQNSASEYVTACSGVRHTAKSTTSTVSAAPEAAVQVKHEHCDAGVFVELGHGPDDNVDLLEKLKNNITTEIPNCKCFPSSQVPPEPGPCYTHLGSAESLPALLKLMEEQTGLVGKALRFEKILYTGKERTTTQGCPMDKWIIRRTYLNEKILCLVKHHTGHTCATSWIVVVAVAWDFTRTWKCLVSATRPALQGHRGHPVVQCIKVLQGFVPIIPINLRHSHLLPCRLVFICLSIDLCYENGMRAFPNGHRCFMHTNPMLVPLLQIILPYLIVTVNC